MKYNFSKLKGKITEVFGTQKEFAKRIDIEPTTLSNKINGNSCFNVKEIEKAIVVLGIDRADIIEYFLTPEVQHEH